jgi:hypothetical protein
MVQLFMLTAFACNLEFMPAVLATINIFILHHQTFLVGGNDKNIINTKMRKSYGILRALNLQLREMATQE